MRLGVIIVSTHQIKVTMEIAQPSRAHISRAAIDRLYIEMRHLIQRGRYKPRGRSGSAMIEALLDLNPEIYGSIDDPNRVELNGLLYVFERLPRGIEECRYIKLISREGLEESGFEPLIPAKRRRNCYRIDEEQMYVEMTRGNSDVYDILTHLTFLYNEAEKIGRNAIDTRGNINRAWKSIKKIVAKLNSEEEIDIQVGFTYLSTLLGRTYEESAQAYERFAEAKEVNDLFRLVYAMGRLSLEESIDKDDREISFSSALVRMLGHHIYGEKWANNIKKFLIDKGLFDRPVHVISANMHSVMNLVYARQALGSEYEKKSVMDIAHVLSDDSNKRLREEVKEYALEHGMYELKDQSGTNLSVQIFEIDDVSLKYLKDNVNCTEMGSDITPVIIVMDYAFGEQAYETMDELLKPLDQDGEKIPWDVQSVNVMGKAGILSGKKGDIMIPTSHVIEGRGDNYPFTNELNKGDFQNVEVDVFEGNMITVLGTSLQNKDILRYFYKSSWAAIGLEMEGAHYQKAIQANSKIRKAVSPDIQVRYAYYASDNPLHTGSTLASGSLGLDGVVPTYLITIEIVKGILESKC